MLPPDRDRRTRAIAQGSRSPRRHPEGPGPQLPAARRSVAGGGEELELDVVGVAEHQYGAVGLVRDWRLRQRLVGRVGADDAVGFEVLLPRHQVGPGGNDEAGVAEAGDGLGEEGTVVGVVAVKDDDEVHGVGGEQLADTTSVRHVHLVGDPEDGLVPRDAGIDIGDGDGDVVQRGLGDGGHGFSLRLGQLRPPIDGTASMRRTIRLRPARIMRELPRIQPERGTRSVAGMAEFFGRPHELEVVAAALARAFRERRPTAVVVDGEPGVGKSRLIDEASRNFRGDRLAVSAYEPEMSLPFSLGHDLTRALARSSRAAGQILEAVLAPQPGGQRPDWSSVFEAAHRAAGVSDSLFITIDDFQWCDERSTALIHYLIRGAQADS